MKKIINLNVESSIVVFFEDEENCTISVLLDTIPWYLNRRGVFVLEPCCRFSFIEMKKLLWKHFRLSVPASHNTLMKFDFQYEKNIPFEINVV